MPHIEFSNRISALQPSTIREILKVTADKEVISLAAGNPAAESFPSAKMAAIAAYIFQNNPAAALQYGISEGAVELRTLTATRMKEQFQVGRDFDDCIIVSGGQQGIELTAKVFLNEGDTLLCETPSFIGALNAFRSYKANLVGIPMEEDGIDLTALEQALKTEKNVKLLYVIPTFQNPSGKTMSLEKRKALLDLANKYNFYIIEDSPYFELRYSGQPVPSIKSLDTEGRVIYVGSYSKVLAPGIRVGYVIAEQSIISKIVVAKQVSDVHTNQFFMLLVAEYLKKYDMNAHIRNLCELYRVKRDSMHAAMQEYFDKSVTYTVPDGGLFLWAELPKGYDGFELCRRASQKKVAAVPGSSFFVDESAVSGTFRLNFSLPGIEKIQRGIQILGESIHDYLGGK